MSENQGNTSRYSTLKRIDDSVARGEAAVALAMLLTMLVVAFAQAALRNLTNAGVGWANVALEWFDWADFILTKGTLWLAFLGASLAIHADKHVAIDIVPRFSSPRARLVMRALVGWIGSVICFLMARAFWSAVLINGEEVSSNYEVLTPEGMAHVCDAPAQVLQQLDMKAGPYCIVRSLLASFGVRMDTPGAAFQLIVPLMFSFMGVRMLFHGLGDTIHFAQGGVADSQDAHGVTGIAADVAADLGHGRKEG
jgi:TRAP-type C4-dicarboxylate transport system permease small subunit